MNDLLATYREGNCKEVRDAVCRSWSNLDREKLIEIADEFVERSIQNLKRIHDSLLKLGYRFASPDSCFVLHEFPDDNATQSLKTSLGEIPLIVDRWYRRVKSVDFSQCHEQFTDRTSPLSGLGWHTLLIVQSIDNALQQWEEYCEGCESDNEHRKKNGDPVSPAPSPVLFIGGSASNCDSKGFELPNSGFDGVLYNDGGGDMRFGDELAEAFGCCGFPVLNAPESTLKLIRTLYGNPDTEFVRSQMPKDLLSV
jgi:hypothetical protein